MRRLTEDQELVLNYIAHFYPANGPHEIVERLRPAWGELVQLGLIEPITKFYFTDAGRSALAQSVEKK